MWKRTKPRTDRRIGISFRVTSVAAAVVAVTLIASGIALVVLMNQLLIAGLDETQLARARFVVAQAAVSEPNGLIPGTATDSSLVQILDLTGKVIASTSNVEGEIPILKRPPAVRQTTALTLTDSSFDAGADFRVVAEPTKLRSGPGWVYVAVSLAQVDAAVTSLIRLFAIGLPIIVVVVAVIAWLTVRQSLRPVEGIRRRAAAIGAADLSQRVPVPSGRDEIAHLAETMNDMLDRIERAAVRQGQFVGDASHELRSPLAALQAQVDVAIAHPENAGPANVLPKMRDQVRRMTMLIDDLLFLARSTETAPMVVPTPVDLDELILTEAQRLRDLGEPSVHVGPLDAARVRGSFRDLTRMLRNLGDNAHDHARSAITLSLTTDEHTAHITVTDDGPGIPAGDRERIFARFSRLDDSRVRKSSGGGSGLGLSIAQQIIEASGGTLVVQDRTDGKSGAEFVARIPLKRS